MGRGLCLYISDALLSLHSEHVRARIALPIALSDITDEVEQSRQATAMSREMTRRLSMPGFQQMRKL